MKELDVLLEGFIGQHADALKAGKWPELEALLAMEDDQLWDCLLHPHAKADPEFHTILATISHGTAHAD